MPQNICLQHLASLVCSLITNMTYQQTNTPFNTNHVLKVRITKPTLLYIDVLPQLNLLFNTTEAYST